MNSINVCLKVEGNPYNSLIIALSHFIIFQSTIKFAVEHLI